MIVKTKMFWGLCKVTIATGANAWDVVFRGPGILKESPKKVEICTEFGDACYDARCVVGYMISDAKGGMTIDASASDEDDESGEEELEV